MELLVDKEYASGCGVWGSAEVTCMCEEVAKSVCFAAESVLAVRLNHHMQCCTMGSKSRFTQHGEPFSQVSGWLQAD